MQDHILAPPLCLRTLPHITATILTCSEALLTRAETLMLHFAPFTSETKQQDPSSESVKNFYNYCPNYNHACTAAIPLWALWSHC